MEKFSRDSYIYANTYNRKFDIISIQMFDASSSITMTLTLLFLLSLLAFSQATSLERYFDPKIIGGEDAKLGEFPYQVSIQTFSLGYLNDRQNFSICSGSILNKNYVITAANCVYDIALKDIMIYAGTINLKQPKSIHKVEEKILHEDYKNIAPKKWNNIALLKVIKPFRKSCTVGFVRLPPKNLILKADQPVVVSGWGYDENNSANTILQRVKVFITDTKKCKKEWGDGLNTTLYMCAYDRRRDKGICRNDEGSPLTVHGIFVGMASYWRVCADTAVPAMYTRISGYLDWIQANAV